MGKGKKGKRIGRKEVEDEEEATARNKQGKME
jgi:hypothetical protein